VKVLLLSKYGYKGASSRYRTYQYIPCLEENGVKVTVAALFDDEYLDRLYGGERISAGQIAAYYTRRLATVLRSASFDLVWIEKELFPWLPFWLEGPLLKRLKPFVVDYDDAIFHNYDQHRLAPVRQILGRKIDSIMKLADLVIAGNDYLAQRARLAGAQAVAVVPTVIDLLRYPQLTTQSHEPFTIGWIGSPSATRHIRTIEPALWEFCADGKSRVRVVGGSELTMPGVPLELLPWSEQSEHELMRTFDVGIMPLPESPWERGKCGFKLVQYMACGLPVVASPVGVNTLLVEEGVNGFLAAQQADWVNALAKLRDDASLRRSMGLAGRSKVEAGYCLQVTAPKIVNLLKHVAANKLCMKAGESF
jgi:glycosyltransferase involved in cell wall biosynthesis